MQNWFHRLVQVLLSLNITSEKRRAMISSLSYSTARFYGKTISNHCLDPQAENCLFSILWVFRLTGFLDRTGCGRSRDVVIDNFSIEIGRFLGYD